MTKRLRGLGILKQGFKIWNSVYTVSIPSGTFVIFLYDLERKRQEIHFNDGIHKGSRCDGLTKNFPVSISRSAYNGEFGRWIANVYGCPMSIHYDDPSPYPISYFEKS